MASRPSVRLSVCLSVCLSVTLVNCEHIGWNSSDIISRLGSLGSSLLPHQKLGGYPKGKGPRIYPEVGRGMEKAALDGTKQAIDQIGLQGPVLHHVYIIYTVLPEHRVYVVCSDLKADFYRKTRVAIESAVLLRRSKLSAIGHVDGIQTWIRVLENCKFGGI